MKRFSVFAFAACAFAASSALATHNSTPCVPGGTPAVLTTDPGLHLLVSLEESSGTRMDGSPKYNDLSPLQSPSRSADHQEGAFSLDLTESGAQYLERTSASLGAGFPGRTGGANSALTIAGWVKTKSAGNHPLVIKADGNQLSWSLWVWNLVAGPVIDPNIFNASGRSYGDRGVADFGGTTVLQIGRWYHFAYTYDGSTGLSRVYVNGALDAGPFNENMTTYFTGTAPLRLGYRPGFGASNTYADVRLDEVVILDRALGAAEVAAVYQYGVVPPTVFCDDGDVCNGQETCDPDLGCQPGVPLDCDDGDPCTVDTCDADAGCVNTGEPTCGVTLNLTLTTLVSERRARRDGSFTTQGYLSDPVGAFIPTLLAAGASVQVTGAGSVADTFGWSAQNCSAEFAPFGLVFAVCSAGADADPIHVMTILPTRRPDVFLLYIAAVRRPIPRNLTDAPVTVQLTTGSIAVADTAQPCRVFGSTRRTSVCQ